MLGSLTSIVYFTGMFVECSQKCSARCPHSSLTFLGRVDLCIGNLSHGPAPIKCQVKLDRGTWASQGQNGDIPFLHFMSPCLFRKEIFLKLRGFDSPKQTLSFLEVMLSCILENMILKVLANCHWCETWCFGIFQMYNTESD